MASVTDKKLYKHGRCCGGGQDETEGQALPVPTDGLTCPILVEGRRQAHSGARQAGTFNGATLADKLDFQKN